MSDPLEDPVVRVTLVLLNERISSLEQKLKEVEKERNGLYVVIRQMKELFQKHCDHEWKTHDDSFDHAFGTEKDIYDECEHCELRRPYEKHEHL